jgi:hypothetical protein
LLHSLSPRRTLNDVIEINQVRVKAGGVTPGDSVV